MPSWTTTIVNLTNGTLILGTGTAHAINLCPRSESTTIGTSKFTLHASVDEKLASRSDSNTTHLTFRIPTAVSKNWRRITTAENHCSLTIFCAKIARKHRKVLVFPKRNLACFLSDMPDTTPLSALCLAGTHDTMALYGWPISQCQSLSLADQLNSGIRALDVRLSVVSGNTLIAYHGIVPQLTSFPSILITIHTFLLANPGEALVMSIMQEDFPKTSRETFSALVFRDIASEGGGKDMWFLENRVPRLGEVRGRVIMVSRFGGDGDDREKMGVHPTYWPASQKEVFEWQCKETVVRTQDWYNIGSFLSIPEKASVATNILLPSPQTSTSAPVLSISFSSAASYPLAFPSTVASGFGWPSVGLGVEGVNGRIVRWLVSQLSSSEREKNKARPRIRGWMFSDFCDDPKDALVPLLVECNYWGRIVGEEGW